MEEKNAIVRIQIWAASFFRLKKNCPQNAATRNGSHTTLMDVARPVPGLPQHLIDLICVSSGDPSSRVNRALRRAYVLYLAPCTFDDGNDSLAGILRLEVLDLTRFWWRSDDLVELRATLKHCGLQRLSLSHVHSTESGWRLWTSEA